MFKLARDLGVWNVDALERQMTSPQLVDWMAFYQVEFEIQTNTLPPLEFDNAAEHSAAIDAIF